MRIKKLAGVGLILLVGALLQAQTGYPRLRRATSTTGINPTGAHRDLAGSFHGTLKQLTSKEIVIQNEEEQAVVIRRSKKTKFLMGDKEIKPSAIALNTLVTVDAAEDIDLKPIAVAVTIDIPKPDSPEKQ